MSLPKLKTGETRLEFMEKCLMNPVIAEKFKSPHLRFAVCNQIYYNERNKTD